ncbi:MAG TPA: hypothetical protein VF696_01275 [Candidatus Paceibacterota bacterium]|jgi:hypothetical protein
MTRPGSLIALLGAIGTAFVPHTTYAAQTFKQIVDSFFVPLGDLVVALLYALAFLFFLFGIVRFSLAGKNAEAREKGKQVMLWGIIALVVLFGVWGIVRFLLSVLTTWA